MRIPVAASTSYENLVDRQLDVVKTYQRRHGVTFSEAMNATHADIDKMRCEWAATTPWQN